MIKENIDRVLENIKEACIESGRDSKEVSLICVSKTKPVSMIEEAYEHGCRLFGENKVQELCDKHDHFKEKGIDDIEWHLIGHLQTNKVKYVVDKVKLIHSVDSFHLASCISKEALKKNVCVNILIEVNMAGEETKFGIRPEECEELLRQISVLPAVKVCGLMTIAPFVENPEENLQHFSNLRKLLIDMDNKNIDNISMGILSMGMTNDYCVAVTQGATLVRVGTGIFGERDYTR